MTRLMLGCARPAGRFFEERSDHVGGRRDAAPFSNPRELQRTREPLERATALPQAAFIDPRVLDWELEHVFMSGWLGVAQASTN